MADLLAQIDSEIQAGLKNEASRLDDALFNLEFYRANFERFPPDCSGKWESTKPRTSPIMRRIVQTLTANLYAKGPARTLKAPEGGDVTAYKAASEWLNNIYRANNMDAAWQDADRLATVGDFCGFQVKGTRDPRKPVQIYLRPANELVVWVHPEDQLQVVAVATLERVDNQRRLTLWTAERIEIYVTEKWNSLYPNGATTYHWMKGHDNPYGIIPFAFVHFEFPTCDFYTDGPGTGLRELNDGMNCSHTELKDGVRFNLNSPIILKNVLAGWTPPAPMRPGDIWELPSSSGEGDGNQAAERLASDSSYVAAGWDDAQSFLDHCLSMYGVPPATIRLVQDSARSGASIVAEQIPLILWAMGRQRPFSAYEDALAKTVLTVGAKHLEAQDFDVYRAAADQLATVATEPGLVLRWPSMYPRLPGEERDREDKESFEMKLTSRTRLLMAREGMTREEARQQLKEISEDLKYEQEIFGDLEPPPLAGNGQRVEPTTVEDLNSEEEDDPATSQFEGETFDE